jgi:hypothetical protein
MLFDWWFYEQCADHDMAYQVGGRERTRWRVDWLFFAAMIRHTGRLPLIQRPFAFVQAVFFYVMVVIFGWSRFEYRR